MTKLLIPIAASLAFGSLGCGREVRFPIVSEVKSIEILEYNKPPVSASKNDCNRSPENF
jgi:hypothetical protein